MASKKSKPSRSCVWTYMEKKCHDTVKCLICECSLRYFGSTSNMLKHIRSQHSVEFAELLRGNAQEKPEKKMEIHVEHPLANRPRRTISGVWVYMEKTAPEEVVCRICKFSLKYSGSTSNLLKHVRTHHTKEFEELTELEREKAKNVLLGLTDKTPASFVNKKKLIKIKSDVSKKKELDQMVISMIIQDLLPFSVVEDSGFRRLIMQMDAFAELPSRHELTRNILPKLYEGERNRVMSDIQSAHNISLTTDLWTSRTTQDHIISVSANFITSDWELKSVVLESAFLVPDHTATHVAEEVTRICQEWNILEKVCSVVTDNSVTMISAVNDIMKLNHLPCFAHTLNLVVNDAIENTQDIVNILKKVKEIGIYFHHSVQASDILKGLQQHNAFLEKKLIHEVESRWNATFYMMQRYYEQNELISTTLCLLGENDMCTTGKEVSILGVAIEVLEPFEMATREMTSEKFTSLSKAIPLIRSLQDFMQKDSHFKTFPLAIELLEQMKKRFPILDDALCIGASTLLDPRFKQLAFADSSVVQKIDDLFMSLIESGVSNDSAASVSPMKSSQTTSPQAQKKSLWSDFDSKVYQYHAVCNMSDKSSGLSIELRKYLEEALIPRQEDPLVWWSLNARFFPQLQALARRFLCIPATSIPAEMLFSKKGDMVSLKRSCLKAKYVDKVLFLNKNMEF